MRCQCAAVNHCKGKCRKVAVGKYTRNSAMRLCPTCHAFYLQFWRDKTNGWVAFKIKVEDKTDIEIAQWLEEHA